MGTLTVRNLSVSFSADVILDNISITVDDATHAALVGENGSGKSTFLKAISGLLAPDTMDKSVTKGMRISYMAQEECAYEDISLRDAIDEGFSHLKELETRMENSKSADEISKILETLTDSGYWERNHIIESIAYGLSFGPEDLSRPVGSFSGGERMRIELAKTLAERPDFLLLDEPTNFLDIDSLVYLEEYLKRFEGGYIVVSHDRKFLDNITDKTYEIRNGKLTEYTGNYSEYLEIRKIKEKEEEKSRRKKEAEIKRTEEFIERFRYKATKSKQVQSRIKSLEKMGPAQRAKSSKTVNFSFKDAPHSGRDVLSAENISKSYGDKKIFSSLSLFVSKGDRIAITGKNGAGKSTLMRILAGEDSDYDGVVRDGSGVVKAYFTEGSGNLNPSNTVLGEAENAAGTADIPNLRNLLGAFLFTGDDVFKKVSVLSGGEKSRLSLIKVLLKKSNLLLLDEPTNHLDIPTKLVLEEAVKEYGGTVIFISHDRHFIENVATKIIYLSDSEPEFYDSDYEYFESRIRKKEEELAKTEKVKKEVKRDGKKIKNRMKSLERKSITLLEEIDRLTEELKQYESMISDPEIYSYREKITPIMKKIEELKDSVSNKESQWMETEAEIAEYGKNQ